MKNLRWLALTLFYYTILVIVWGAWVRISHSGDGCGESWPLCAGELIPDFQQKKTWVEYAHRAMSGIFGIYVLFLVYITFKKCPKNHPLRSASLWVLFFTITEALLGAKLVLLGLVNTNTSVTRTLVMALHQINSFLLTGACALYIAKISNPTWRWKHVHIVIAILFILLGVTGAWAALASTLFPSQTLWEGIAKDFATDSHHALRLRFLHPLLALAGIGTFSLILWVKQQRIFVVYFLVAGLVFGLMTLLSLSPTWMKLSHLAFAHFLWGLVITEDILRAPRA